MLLFGRGVVHRIHDAGGHCLDERHGVAHNFAPLIFRPDSVPGPLSVDKAVVAPDVLDIVQVANLGERSHESLGILVVTHTDALGPEVAPFHHGAWFQIVAGNKNTFQTPRAPRSCRLNATGYEMKSSS